MTTSADFTTEQAATNPGYNAPQKMGRRLWLPMFFMALMAFPIALGLSWFRAAEIASSTPDSASIGVLDQLVPGFQFLGFAAVFAAISFTIARILGQLRSGGGSMQEATGNPVLTPKMPPTARIFMLFMMMGMMTVLVAVVGHFVVAGNVDAWSAASVTTWGESLGALRKLGVGLYLFGITFGLGTIVEVLRFQAIRSRELVA